ncbi:MAG: M28 family metallopeptidase [Acidobacteriota bacterium]
MRRSTFFLVSIVVWGFGDGVAGEKQQDILGFHDGGAERVLEARFDAQLDGNHIRDWMKRLSARPHHVGSRYGKENALFIASLFRSWGYQTEMEEFHVLFPTPKSRLLELVAPAERAFSATLKEPPLERDSTSGQTDEQLPTYNAYSADGDVTSELVYVNYGVPDDYEELARHKIDVKGRIVIARYGGSWRGIKPKVAAEHGAIGCILYSDPRDDGFFQGDVYPEGAFRNEKGAQRGSVMDMPLYPGDPLTPGRGALKDAARLPVREAPTLTRIPVLPISYSDALPLLRALGGAVAPSAWRGALPVTYHIGPGPARVHLKVEFNWDIASAYDVIAKLPGSEKPDQWIIRGNHHDAWVNGAKDPVSGMAALMEEARAIGVLAKGGWAPGRTLVYAAWDAEEPGLIGSTEWVEAHADLLRGKAVVYINSDSNGRGFLSVGGSHTLEKFINQVARDVVDPQKAVSVWERWRARRLAGQSLEARQDTRKREDLRIAALGSGSDYTPFLQHLGIASLNIGFGGEDRGGSYHSIYDSFDHYARFADPTFQYGVALAQVCGRAVLRLANSEILPFEFTRFADTIQTYVGELTELTKEMRSQTADRNWRIENHVDVIASDPLQPYGAPPLQDPVPFLNFAPLKNAAAGVEKSAAEYDTALAQLGNGDSVKRKGVDEILMRLEQSLTSRSGLPGRPWYTHYIYAPGFYTGYGVKTLPAVREAIEMRKWKEAEEQITATAQILLRFAQQINRATAALTPD